MTSSGCYVLPMARKEDTSEFQDPSEDAKQAAVHLTAGVDAPLPGETVADYWKRMGPIALQATMIRALHGDNAASATMFEMVKAPVVEGAKAQVQLTNFSSSTKGANRLAQSITAPIDEARALLARGGLSTAQGPTR